MKQEAVDTLIVKQVTAASAIGGSILGWWPVILAIPAAVYYIILIIEKVTGRSLSDIIAGRNKQ